MEIIIANDHLVSKIGEQKTFGRFKGAANHNTEV
jgi:hypothetical protein